MTSPDVRQRFLPLIDFRASHTKAGPQPLIWNLRKQQGPIQITEE